eukprot:6356612-Prymnesium_polylepis.1
MADDVARGGVGSLRAPCGAQRHQKLDSSLKPLIDGNITCSLAREPGVRAGQAPQRVYGPIYE